MSKKVALERAKRLSVCTGTVASRLAITGDEKTGHTVTGVHIRPSKREKSDKNYFVKARREVVLACGAMTTPQLLLLSGIGPSGEDSTESRLGIPLVKELPAVGADFSDHYAVPVMLELPRNDTFGILQSLWALWYILLWIFTGKGYVSFSATPTAIFLHTDSINDETMQVWTPHKKKISKDHDVPNIEIMLMPVNSFQRPLPNRSLFSFYSTVLQPRAKGKWAKLFLSR